MKILSESKRISLWILPPEPLRTTLSSIQSDIIASHPKDRRLPTFLPHVTLIGGIPISECCSAEEIKSGHQQHDDGDIDEEAARVVLRRLQLAFQSHGGITCKSIEEKGVFAERTPAGDGASEGMVVKWNQSCVSILERNSSLMKAMQVADDALFATTGNNKELPMERHFKLPLFEPHYSFVYGNDAHLIPASLECPPTFTSTEMVVMWTHPSELAAVESWKEIGRVSMPQRSMI